MIKICINKCRIAQDEFANKKKRCYTVCDDWFYQNLMSFLVFGVKSGPTENSLLSVSLFSS